MQLPTAFDGRVVQVTEALSFQDAVSNQILALDSLFKGMGLRSEVYSKWHDARVASRRHDISELVLDERDIVILHYYGYSEHTPDIIACQYCTRILLYHNITPAEHFPPASRMHEFCRLGREELAKRIKDFHFFWADSQFNLDELVTLGAAPEHSFVIPIIVEPPSAVAGAGARVPGSWLFVGRFAGNKAHLELLDMFAEVRARHPAAAVRLELAGAYEEGDDYIAAVRARISALGLEAAVRLHGKVSDAEREHLFRCTAVYVSLSQHEGFGVPLVEAALRDLPVVALALCAVPETMNHGAGLVQDDEAARQLVMRLHGDADFRAALLVEQRRNAARFAASSVSVMVLQAWSSVLPALRRFRRVSVVICTYNRCSYLERVLDYLGHQSSGAFEVVVVDGPSNDGTKRLLASCGGRVKVAHNPLRNLSVSRNMGIELADGDVIAFIDDDALPFDDWIENILLEYNRRPLTTAGLGGPAYYAGTFWFQAQDNSINSRAEANPNVSRGQIGKDGWLRYNTGTNATFTAAALRKLGGFDEQFDYYLDESEVCFALQIAGQLIGYATNVVVRHEFAQSHNRQGRLNYNWFTICKNTAYFVCAYSGLRGAELDAYLDEKVRRARMAPVVDALNAASITNEEHDRHARAIDTGIAQGIADARAFPRRRELQRSPDYFKPYAVSGEFPAFAAGRRPLHICIISKELPPFAAGGGIGTLYYHLASELLLMGNVVSAIVPGTDPKPFQQGNMRVFYTLAPAEPKGGARVADGNLARNVAWSLAAMAKAAEIHAALPIDIIESALWDAEALAIALLPQEARPPVVLRLVTPYAVAADINGWGAPPDVRTQFVAAETALMERADAVVPISDSIASTVLATYDVQRSERWHRIPCGIAYWPFFDVNQGYDELPQVPGLNAETLGAGRMLLFVGRLERRKGIDLVFEAAPEFLAFDPSAQLVIAGRDVEGWASRVDELVPARYLSRIHFLGEVPDSTRDKLMARAYCQIFPSRYESFGIVPLEGFVHGTPVVAASAGAIPEVVQHGVCGLLFPPEDSAALAAAIVRLLKDPELRHQLSIGALKRVRELSSRNSAIQTQQLYESLVPTRHAKPTVGVDQS